MPKNSFLPGMVHQEQAGLVLCRTSQDLKNKIVLVTPVLEPHIGVLELGLHLPSNIALSSGRIEESPVCAPDSLTNHPEALKILLVTFALLFPTSLLCT